MIHEGECKIVVDLKGLNMNIMGVGAEPPIPTDEDLEVFLGPDYIARGKIFIARCFKEQGMEGMDMVTPQDMFRLGMKFIICEAKKIAGI